MSEKLYEAPEVASSYKAMFGKAALKVMSPSEITRDALSEADVIVLNERLKPAWSDHELLHGRRIEGSKRLLPLLQKALEEAGWVVSRQEGFTGPRPGDAVEAYLLVHPPPAVLHGPGLGGGR